MNKSSIEKFILESNIIHDFKYDYSQVIYKNSQTKVEIICPIHGSFFQIPNNHKIQKRGCKKCGSVKGGNNHRFTIEKFIELANKTHNDYYNYSFTKYIRNHSKIEIICPIHGSFWQEASSHLNGCGCPKCSKIKIGNDRRKSNEQFINHANKIHKHKYDYSIFRYLGAHEHGEIICKKHGTFSQNPTNHLQGKGCPKCSCNVSIPEKNFMDYIILSENNRHKYIKPYKVDGYDPLTNTIYEFLGNYWHGNPKLYDADKIHPKTKITFGKMYKNTMTRLKKIKSLGYNIKYIWENDWNNFKRGIEKFPNIITL